ncbi:FAD dependent oxidoreductase [Neurospora intermedia]|uniref:FAD dependent oxidoreductase n=1 Tax=Neurospora intermedia TaxID=5142 RepID=A0ABR3DIL5_NEUIN
MSTIVVVGAGVSGLTCALQLAKQGGNTITVVAKHMPGDYDPEYTSPFAGANVLPMAPEYNRWEGETWPELKRLAETCPEAGIHFQKAVLYRRPQDEASAGLAGPLAEGLFVRNPWFKDVMPDYVDLPASEVPEGMSSASSFTSVCINTAIYLPWLVGQCRARGVVFKRAVLKHISDAAKLSHTGRKPDIIINATGLLSCRLGGVMDQKVMPARGQVVLVRNEATPNMVCTSGTDDGNDDELCYIMQRAAGGGTVLGGTYMKGNWDSVPDPNIATRIMKRAVEACPALTGGKGIEALDVIRHAVGLRPYREGGVRIEKENIDGTWVVHNYGHGGWGYQGSWGCAFRVQELVDEIKSELKVGSKL